IARQKPEDRAREIERASTNDWDVWAPARLAGLSASVGDWMNMHARREEYRQSYRAFFRDWDILLAPITLLTAFPHVEIPFPPGDALRSVPFDVDGTPHPYGDQLVYPSLATLCGQPSTAFPVGLSGAGLPMGLQAIGPYLEDLTPIRFAGLAAEEMGGYVRPPGYSD